MSKPNIVAVMPRPALKREPDMNREEHNAVLAIAIHAAFSDVAKGERERDKVRRAAKNLADESGSPDLPRLYQDVLLMRLSLSSVTATLTDSGQRQLADKMARRACQTDRRLLDGEQRFLDELKRMLGLPATQAEHIGRENDTLGDQTEFVPSQPAAALAPPVGSAIADAEQDTSIRKHALPAYWNCFRSPGPRWRSSRRRSRWFTASERPTACRWTRATSRNSSPLPGRAHSAISGTVRPQTDGRPARQGSGQDLRQGRRHGDRRALFLRHHLFSGPGRPAVLRRWANGGQTKSSARLHETVPSLLGLAKQIQTQYLPQIRQRAATLLAGQVTALIRA